MSNTRSFAVQSVLAVGAAVAFFLATQSCGAECIDKFDCALKATKGQTLTCSAGKCVPDSAAPADAGK